MKDSSCATRTAPRTTTMAAKARARATMTARTARKRCTIIARRIDWHTPQRARHTAGRHSKIPFKHRGSVLANRTGSLGHTATRLCTGSDDGDRGSRVPTQHVDTYCTSWLEGRGARAHLPAAAGVLTRSAIAIDLRSRVLGPRPHLLKDAVRLLAARASLGDVLPSISSEQHRRSKVHCSTLEIELGTTPWWPLGSAPICSTSFASSLRHTYVSRDCRPYARCTI